jgi:predicted RNA-binding Zn-ribbon protein involved in translation (DUF1610 family)
MQSLGLKTFAVGEFLTSIEGMQFEVYVCPKCRESRLFLPDPTRVFHKPLQDSRTPKAYLKKCVECRKLIAIASEECPFCGSKQPPLNKR